MLVANLQLVAVAAAFGALLFLTKPLWSRTFPGPLFAKYGRLWYLYQMYKTDFHLTNIRLHRKHGKFVQVMPGYISVDDPETHKAIYSLGSAWPKSDYYIAWNVGPSPEYTNLFSEMKEDRHSAMKRKVAGMYSVTSLVSYEPYVDECINLLHGHFSKFAESKTIINLAHWCQCFAFDAITTITFGERLGFLDEGEDCANLMQDISRSQCSLIFIGLFPNLSSTIKWCIDKLSSKTTLAFLEFVQKKIALAKEADAVEHDGPDPMVQKFADTQKKGTKGVTDWELFAHSGANIGAGSDSTSSTLAAILYYIYRNPDVLQRLRKELDDADVPSRPSYRDVQQLPYMQATFKEAFRMAPGAGIPLWREVPQGGATISGQYFPAGTNLGINTWVAHHNIDVYGPDADTYRPTRWLEGDEASIAAMDHSLCNFGLGTRTCIGKNIALLEINKIVPVLVREFEFEFRSEELEKSAPYPPTKNEWFIKLPNLEVVVSRRTDVS